MAHDGHRERTKERFLAEGLKSFAPHNILELLLYFVIPRRDTNGTAHELMDTFGSLSNVFDAPYEELLKVRGVGKSAALLIKLIPALSSAYLNDKVDVGIQLDNSDSLGKFLLPKYIGQTREQIYMVCLDNKCKLLHYKMISQGSFNSASLNLRDFVEFALRCSASAVVISHNHPHGFAIPSEQDLTVTRKLQEILKPFDIRLLDHIIVARDDFVSLADSGFFAEVPQ